MKEALLLGRGDHLLPEVGVELEDALLAGPTKNLKTATVSAVVRGLAGNACHKPEKMSRITK
eukprot:1102243-Lingulodinium_polyedra.AAC.1